MVNSANAYFPRLTVFGEAWKADDEMKLLNTIFLAA